MYTETSFARRILNIVSRATKTPNPKEYPRFVRDEEEIKRRALELARRLKVGLGQERVTVVFPDETIMLEDDDNNIDFLNYENKI